MALSHPAAPPFYDTAKLHLPSSAYHQDDLWTACGAYGAGENGLLNTDDELSNMVSMVNSLQDNHHQHHQEVLPSGLHRNASFDSGSTSHDSCTASFSTGSPVTVLPPLPYSSCGDGKEQESSGYMQYVDTGLWATHEQQSSDCAQTLPCQGGENFSSLFLNELPLRSYDDIVHQVDGNKDYLDCVVPAPISSHTPYQTSDNSGSTLESSQVTGITNSSSDCNKVLLGHEHDGSEHNSNQSTHTVSGSSAVAPVESAISPAGQHRRLSWTDHHWPASSTSDRMQVPLNNFQSTTSAQSLLLPHQIVNGLKSNAPAAVANFQDADYLATCNQYRKTQLREINNTGGAATNNSLKRSFLAMQSTAGSNSSTSLAVPPVPSMSQTFKFASGSSQQEDAAALSALLYKNNHGSDLVEKGRGGSSCVSGGSVVGAASGDTATMQQAPKLRRRHGTATDPQSIAARTRRERFSDRIKLLQCLVPNGERLDTVSMLGHTLEYVRFLQHQVWQLYNGKDDASIPQPDSESREKWKEFMDTTQTIALS